MGDYGDVDYYAGEEGGVEDYYEEEEDPDFTDFVPIRSGATIFELYTECLEPTVLSAFNQVLLLFCSCLLFRIFSQIVPGTRRFGHFASIVFGLLGLYGVIGPKVVYTSLFGVSSYAFPLICQRKIFGDKTGRFVTCFLLLYLVFREYIKIIPEPWEEVRGVQMIMVLKILSVSLDSGFLTPSIMEYLGYIFCPGTVVFGPWISFDVYCKIFQRKNWNIGWITKVLATGLRSFLSLGVSSCVVYWTFLGIQSSWILAVRNALSVRFSHYFISFLSELTSLLCGLDDISVADPYQIELPRSLVNVVVFWNKPMHTWLKIYIFRPATHLGVFRAVLLTFLASSMLHGMNFGLTMVLLSLGFYTYVEHSLREKLASVFNACIRSRSCHPGSCKHEFKSTLFSVRLVNLVFGFWAYFHLSYLGVMLDKTHTDQDHQMTVLDTLEQDWRKWGNLNFISHWTMLAVYLGSISI